MSETPIPVANCRHVPIRGASDPRGTVNFLEVGREIDFPVQRAFWIHCVPEGRPRGQHGHRRLSLLLVALAGGCDVVLDDGAVRCTVRLEQPDRGLLVGPWVWHELLDFSAGTVVLALASGLYDEADYIRDYAAFRAEVAARGGRTP